MPDSDGAVAPFRTAYAGTGDGGGRRDDFAEDREDTEIKESPEDSAETLREIEEGTGVIVYGEPQDSWSRVEYDGVSGYMESEALELYMAEGDEELEQEFEEVQEETVRTVEESELIQKSKRTSMIWGIVIAVLVAAIFVVGILSAIKKEKAGEEREEET